MFFPYDPFTSGQLGVEDGLDRPIPTQIGTGADWLMIAAGYNHTLAIKTNRTLWSWGANESGQLGLGNIDDYYIPTSVGTDSDWSSSAAGANHSVALKTNPASGGAGGTIWSWGYNSFGQLGLADSGDGTDRNTPTQIGADSDWSLVVAGAAHTISIKTNYTLWVWGWNEWAQLGDGTFDSRATPGPIDTDSDWSIVTANYSETLALKTNGTLWYWGGDSSYTPDPVGTDTNWKTIAAGGAVYQQEYLLALKMDGTLWANGFNASGQLGLGNYNSSPSGNYSLIQVGTNSDWSSITAGSNHSSGLTTDGALWVWGDNNNYQLGLGDPINRNIPWPLNSPIPPAASSLNATAISSSQINLSWTDNSYNETGFKIERRASALELWNQIITVGANVTSYSDSYSFLTDTVYHYRVKAYNEFGNSPYSNETYMAAPGTWTAVAAGAKHTLTLKTQRTLWAWGYNYYGQLGDGTTDTRTTPRQVFGSTSDWSMITAGGSHTIALKTDRTLWAWGSGYGTIPTKIGTNSDWSLVTSRYGLKTNLTLWTLGTTPSMVGNDSDWSLIAASDSHQVALKTNKTLWAWGQNNYGQLGDGSITNRTTPRAIGTTSDWSKIAVGSEHTLGIKTSGALWTWGRNYYGQLGIGGTLAWDPIDIEWFVEPTYQDTPTQISPDVYGGDWSAAAGSAGHTLALKTQGQLWAWGNNEDGQLGDGNYGTWTTPIPPRTTPGPVGINSDWSSLAAGGSYSLGLKINGTVWTWGNNSSAQLGRDYGPTAIPVPVTLNYPSHIPSSLVATAISSTQINLSWVDNCNIEQGFKIERKTGAGGTWSQINTVEQNVKTYSDTGVSSGTTYYYRIRAYNSYSETNYSNEVSTSTP